MRKVLGGILLVVYSIIAITVTVLLLSYNEYNCSEIGGYTVFIVNDDSLEPDYKQGSILLIKGTSDKNVQIGDEMFLYKVINSQEYELVNRTLADKIQQGNHITYVMQDEENYANDYFVGKASDTVVIEGWGYVLGLLESRWGYLFCVVIVSLLLFLQEVFELAMEIKYGKEDRDGGSENTKEAVNTAKVSTNRATGSVTRTSSAKTGTAKTTGSRSKTSTAKTTSGATKKASSTARTSTARKNSGTTKTSTTGATKTASRTTKTSTAKASSSAVKTSVKDNNEANVEEE